MRGVDRRGANSPPKLGGVPFARFLANGGVAPRENHPVCAWYKVASLHFFNGAATPPNLGGEFAHPIHSARSRHFHEH